MKVFAYGSLLDKDSAGNALGRSVEARDLVPVCLRGFRRTWGVVERVFSEYLDREVVAAFLDIRRAPGEVVNGAVFSLTAGELARLEQREKNYLVIDVSRAIEPFGTQLRAERIVSFCGKRSLRPEEVTGEVVVLAKYIERVQRACLLLGGAFVEEFERTTAGIPYEIVSGAYRFIDENQENLV